MAYTITPNFQHITQTGDYELRITLTDERVSSWNYRIVNEEDLKYLDVVEDGGQTNYLDLTIEVYNLPISSKIIYIEIIGKKSNGTKIKINYPVYLNQYRIPIWADAEYVYKSDNGGSIEYEIVLENADDNNVNTDTIYSGKLTPEPGKDIVRKKLNPIIANYLNSKCPIFVEGVHKMPNYSAFINVYNVNYDSDFVYIFFNSYSYTDDIPQNGITGISKPIRNIIDPRQYLLSSVLLTGNEDEMEINDNGNIRYEYGDLDCAYTTVKTNLQDGQYYQFDDILYMGKKTCYDYCLYYVNAYGGWDSLLIQGNAKKNDKITSSYYTKSFNNITTEFEKVKYNNQITTEYKLYTDWFTDEEQSKLHHLLESTEVYLHDLNNDVVMPCIITNTNCEWKTFTNNGKKKFYNEINVECSQMKIRR